MYINILAILVSAIVCSFLGYFWYSKKMFGDTWMRLSGLPMTPADPVVAKKVMMKGVLMTLIGWVLSAWVLANVIALMGTDSFGGGLEVGFFAWLGLVAPAQIGMVMWERKPWKYFWITSGYQLVGLLVTSVILALW
ncbi:MAG: DUF1761 domain-containing protein [Patescibacteria group bacterium]